MAASASIRGPAMALGLAAAAAWGCAGSAHLRAPAALPPVRNQPRVALLPLENLSGKADAADIVTRIAFVELVSTGCCDVVDAGEVEAALDSMGVRATGALTAAQLGELSARTGARLVLVGSLLESGSARTPDGSVPTISLAFKLLETDSGRVVWAASGFRTGDDRETVFGIGRELSAERLAGALTAELLDVFRRAARSARGKGPSR